MHNDAARARFKRDHEIPNDIRVERPSSNKVDTTMRGLGDLIPVCTWLIHQAGLQFPVDLMLKEVMDRCGLTFNQVSINFVLTIDILIR